MRHAQPVTSLQAQQRLQLSHGEARRHELLGRPVLIDFLVDYASASALRHDVDAYGITGPITEMNM